MERAPQFEIRERNHKIIAELSEYLKKGYVLHGSKSDSSVLKPQQAHDTNVDRIVGKAFAIYAEGRDIRIPIFMALKDRKDISMSSESEYSGYGPEKVLTISGRNLHFTPGYVHVLPSETYEIEKHGNVEELISRVPVRAIKIFRVSPSILDALPNIEMNIE
jgi:hypothetical protein